MMMGLMFIPTTVAVNWCCAANWKEESGSRVENRLQLNPKVWTSPAAPWFGGSPDVALLSLLQSATPSFLKRFKGLKLHLFLVVCNIPDINTLNWVCAEQKLWIFCEVQNIPPKHVESCHCWTWDHFIGTAERLGGSGRAACFRLNPRVVSYLTGILDFISTKEQHSSKLKHSQFLT